MSVIWSFESLLCISTITTLPETHITRRYETAIVERTACWQIITVFSFFSCFRWVPFYLIVDDSSSIGEYQSNDNAHCSTIDSLLLRPHVYPIFINFLFNVLLESPGTFYATVLCATVKNSIVVSWKYSCFQLRGIYHSGKCKIRWTGTRDCHTCFQNVK